MRALVPILCMLTLTSCGDSPGLVACEKAIQSKLKAPSSYKRIKADGADDLAWTIEYDAVNAFNAPLRGKGRCFYKDGQADWYETDNQSAP